MPITRADTDETRSISGKDGIEACRIACHGRKQMLLVRCDGGYDVYVPHDSGTVAASLQDAEFEDDMVPARVVDAYVKAVEAIDGVEEVELTVHEYGERPSVSFVAPAYGRVQLWMSQDATPDTLLRRMRREKRQDAEGRTMTRLGAMTLALAANTPEDVDRIVDAVFTGGDVTYMRVSASISREGLITTAYEHQGVQMRSDGIEIADLPETVRTAIKGRQRRRLGDVAMIPGFEGLEIAGIHHNAMSARMWPARSWVRLDVRDADGAKFDRVEIDEAREIAHAMHEARSTR